MTVTTIRPSRLQSRPSSAKNAGNCGDVVDHERADDTVERAPGQRQRQSRDVVDDPVHSGRTLFLAGTGEHPVAEVDADDVRAARGQPQRVAARAAPDVDDVQADDVTDEPVDLRLLE